MHIPTEEEEFEEYLIQYKNTQLRPVKDVHKTLLPLIKIGNKLDIDISGDTEPRIAFAKLKGHYTSLNESYCYDLTALEDNVKVKITRMLKFIHTKYEMLNKHVEIITLNRTEVLDENKKGSLLNCTMVQRMVILEYKKLSSQ